MTDLQLIKKIKDNNCEKSLLELFSRHQGLCNKMLQKYCSICLNLGVSLDDLNTDKLLVVYKSAKSFNINKKNKFSTWLANQIRYHCLNTLNKTSKDVSMENEDIKYIAEKNQKLVVDKKNINQERIDFIHSIINQMSDSRVKEIFHLRYFSGENTNSWDKIGKKMKISTQTAINIHNKTVIFLNKKISSDFLFDKV